MKTLKHAGFPNLSEFMMLHLTPMGWRLKKLAKEGYLEFRRDKQTGKIYVHPTKKSAELVGAAYGIKPCLDCVKNPRVKSMRHHDFLTDIGLKFRESSYLEFKINPMCPHHPERNLGADAVLSIKHIKIAIFAETLETQGFPKEPFYTDYDGIMVFVEGVDARVVIEPHAMQKICFVHLQEFLKHGIESDAKTVTDTSGKSVHDFIRYIQGNVHSRN